MGVTDQRIADLGRSQHDVVGMEQLRALGVSGRAIRRRLEHHRLYRLFRSAYAIGTPRVTQRGLWKAATLSVGSDALIAVTDAAALTDLIRRPLGPIHVLVPGRRPRPQRGIQLHTTRSLQPDDPRDLPDALLPPVLSR